MVLFLPPSPRWSVVRFAVVPRRRSVGCRAACSTHKAAACTTNKRRRKRTTRPQRRLYLRLGPALCRQRAGQEAARARCCVCCDSGPACVLCTQHDTGAVVRLDAAARIERDEADGARPEQRAAGAARLLQAWPREVKEFYEARSKTSCARGSFRGARHGGFLTATRTRCNTPRGNTRRCDQAVTRHDEPASFSSFATACVRNGPACRVARRVLPHALCSRDEATPPPSPSSFGNRGQQLGSSPSR